MTRGSNLRLPTPPRPASPCDQPCGMDGFGPQGRDPRRQDVRTKGQGVSGRQYLRPGRAGLERLQRSTLNDEASISVVDPLFSFGGTKLLGMVVLESPGEDWAMTSNEMCSCVSLPDSKKVAVVDTGRLGRSRGISSWTAGQAGLPCKPTKRALGPRRGSRHRQSRDIRGHGDRHNQTGADRGINTGRGHHEMAFSDDGGRAFVTNERDDTVSVIDTRSLKKEADVPTGSCARFGRVFTVGQDGLCFGWRRHRHRCRRCPPRCGRHQG